MKNISPALQSHLDGEFTTLAEIIKITRSDGRVIAFTTHDRDLYVDGVTYKADGSFSEGVLKQEAKHKANEYDVAGLLNSDLITEEEIEKGLYDHARIDVALCNWSDLSQGIVKLRRGWLSEIITEQGCYIASLKGLHTLLEQRIGETYTPECRYDLGDTRCGVNVDALKVAGTVTGVTSGQIFSDYTRNEPTGTFDHAVLHWTSGANQGLKMEVWTWELDALSFRLWLPMAEPISVGDTYEVAPGCDKRFSTCCSRFLNSVNYGGFPHLPGLGKILEYPDVRS